jgi:hypothetical protein
MKSFTYLYKEDTVESLYALSSEKGDIRYKVKLNDVWFTIVPLDFPRYPDGRIIWHQDALAEGELMLAHDMVQAMGEGIEALSD